MEEIPGWFLWTDAVIMSGIDRYQRAHRITGDLLEIGVYQGKSAILMGYFLRGSERLVVCDMFTAEGSTDDNTKENRQYYADINRSVFEENYRRFHPQLPTIMAKPSSSLSELPPDSFRLVHVDGSHLYEIVRDDLRNTRRLLCDGGVVVIDDWRTGYHPGVVAAAWEAILNDGLLPICFTDRKLYGTWTLSPGPPSDEVASWVAGSPTARLEPVQVFGREVQWIVAGQL
jgi:hypothetical protein